MEFQDKGLKCVDCGDDFIFTAGEQLFFHDKQFKNEPKRCKNCKGKRAQALGLPQKGHLGVGADADLTIYNQNPDGVLMFRYPRYVIKGGEVVVEEGDLRKTVEGREFVVKPAFDEKIEDYLRRGHGTHEAL